MTSRYKNSNKLICGVGINDADYDVQPWINGTKTMCPYYDRWYQMLRRVYKTTRRPYQNYANCVVCDDWLYFMNFKRWMEKEDWQGKQLDKDFLSSGVKTYSPETCIFINNEINQFTKTRNNHKGEHPIGVGFRRGRYIARVSSGDGSRLSLGSYLDPMEAHKAWQRGKIQVGESIILKLDQPLLVIGMRRILDKLQYELDNDIETTCI